MIGLTARQSQCLDVIRHAIGARGYPPTLREIGAAMGIRSTNGVNDHLLALERKGLIKRVERWSRAIRLVNPGGVAGPVPDPGWRYNATPGTFIPRARCLRCGAVTFARGCAVCKADLIEVAP